MNGRHRRRGSRRRARRWAWTGARPERARLCRLSRLDLEETLLESRPVRYPAQKVEQFRAWDVIRVPELLAELVDAPRHDDPPVQDIHKN